MSQRCDLTGKGKQYGHNVPFSQKKTRKVWKANLQKKTFMLNGQKVTMKLSAYAIRTLKKKGLLQMPEPKAQSTSKPAAQTVEKPKVEETKSESETEVSKPAQAPTPAAKAA